MLSVRSKAVASVLAAIVAAPVTVANAGGFGDLASTDWQVGGFVFVAPKYEGSKDYEVRGAPFIAPAGLGDTSRVQFRGPDDLRFRLIEFGGFEAGPLAGVSIVTTTTRRACAASATWTAVSSRADTRPITSDR